MCAFCFSTCIILFVSSVAKIEFYIQLSLCNVSCKILLFKATSMFNSLEGHLVTKRHLRILHCHCQVIVFTFFFFFRQCTSLLCMIFFYNR